MRTRYRDIRANKGVLLGVLIPTALLAITLVNAFGVPASEGRSFRGVPAAEGVEGKKRGFSGGGAWDMDCPAWVASSISASGTSELGKSRGGDDIFE